LSTLSTPIFVSVSVRTQEMIEKVRDFIANNRNASMKMMENALNINRENFRIILHEDLSKIKACVKIVSHTLCMYKNQRELTIQETSLQPPEMIQAFSNQLLSVMKHSAFNMMLSAKVQNGSQKITSSQESTKSTFKN